MRITDLRGRHAGGTCHVVGKGPSLLDLAPDWIGGAGPIIALNEAVVRVEALGLPNPVYSMQKDAGLVRPRAAALLVHEREASRDAFPDHRPRYAFDNPRDFGLRWFTCSVVTAVKVAELFGCRHVAFLCCDACTDRDARTVGPGGALGPANPAYAVQCAQLLTLLRLFDVSFSFVRPARVGGRVVPERLTLGFAPGPGGG